MVVGVTPMQRRAGKVILLMTIAITLAKAEANRL